MTAPLRDLLDDLAASQPVVPHDLGAAAWRRGRRDLLRDRVGTGVAVAAVVAVLALVAPVAGVPVQAPLADRTTSVGGYPEVVGQQLWVRDLPDRPGPVAALLERAHELDTHDEPDGWYAVAPDGHRWRLPGTASTDQVPALSRDGRLLGQLLADEGPYVVHDLVTGQRTLFPDVSGTSTRDVQRFRQTGQTPSSFSPDGRHLLLVGGDADTGGTLVLDLQDTSVRLLDQELGFPAGFVGPDRVVWLAGTGSGVTGAGTSVVRTTDLSGRVLAAQPLGDTPLDQWAGLVSPDGRSLAVVSDGSFDTDVAVRRFDVATGRLLERTAVDGVQGCGSVWPTGSGPVVATYDDEVLAAVEVQDARQRVLARTTDPVDGRCLVWAAEALAGQPHAGGLRGRWERDPALQAGAAALLAGTGLVLLRHRLPVVRRRRSALRRGAPDGTRD